MDRQLLLCGCAASVVFAFMAVPGWAQPAPAAHGENENKGVASVGVARVEQDASGFRTLTLPQPITVKGASGCSTARILKIRAPGERSSIGEPALIQHAITSGKPVWVANGKCSADGIVQGTSIAVEAEPAVVDPCTLPAPSGRHPGCKK